MTGSQTVTVGCDDGGVVATQSDGVIDLTKATVKEEIVKEALDVEKGRLSIFLAARWGQRALPSRRRRRM